VSALQERGLREHTAIIISAKHGQSPMNKAALNRIDDGMIIDALNLAKITSGAAALLANAEATANVANRANNARFTRHNVASSHEKDFSTGDNSCALTFSFVR
jgi:hypothetical protein